MTITYAFYTQDPKNPKAIIKPSFLSQENKYTRVVEQMQIAIPQEEMGLRERIAYLIQQQAQKQDYNLQVPKTELVSLPLREVSKHQRVICSKHQFQPNMRTLSQCSPSKQQEILLDETPSVSQQMRNIAFLDILPIQIAVQEIFLSIKTTLQKH